MEQRLRNSSSVMTGEKRSSISSEIGGLVEENKFVKWETKVAPIEALSESQEPESVLKKLTALDLLLMIVEVWKNLVLSSEHESQSSLDLESSRNDLREVSKEKELELGVDL
jgi:hypothetical protein